MKKILSAGVIALVFMALMIQIGNGFGNEDLGVKTFESYDELKSFLEEKAELGYGGFGSVGAVAQRAGTAEMAVAAAPAAEPSVDYSLTNIQVEGVDEADIVKTDGQYIYVVSGQKVYIVDAHPAEDAQVVSIITLDKNANVQEIFINGDRLVVFGTSVIYNTPTPVPINQDIIRAEELRIAPYPAIWESFINVYDISDRSNPELDNQISMEGIYFDSRMIGDTVYVIVNSPINNIKEPKLPVIISDGNEVTVKAEDVRYFDISDFSYKFTTIFSFDVQGDAEPESKTYLMGQTQTMYVSTDNIYTASQKRISQYEVMDEVIKAVLPDLPLDVANEIRKIQQSGASKPEQMREIGQIMSSYMSEIGTEEQEQFRQKVQEVMSDISRKAQRTIIHRISISDGNIEHKAGGIVPGMLLNQFSMDEFEGKLRVATTITATFGPGIPTESNVYVLDSSLNIIGRLEGLAPGERIFSARFMGEKAYLVTFRQVDPLFVIDLSDPTNPEVAGELKIPGFSSYLHPYDENYIIGVGKDADPQTGRALGLKIGLFDVSDPENPKEVATYIVDGASDSEALRDHKAFLFDKEKNLLVIPVTKWSTSVGVPGFPPVQPFNGAYVFDISAEDGIELRGKISHEGGNSWASSVRRSLYIEDALYTISQNMVKINELSSLETIGSVELE